MLTRVCFSLLNYNFIPGNCMHYINMGGGRISGAKSRVQGGGVRQPHIIYCTSRWFTAASKGLLQPHKVYCSLTRFTAASRGVLQPPKVYCNLSRCTATSRGVLQPPKVYCSLTRFTAASLRFDWFEFKGSKDSFKIRKDKETCFCLRRGGGD